MNRNDIINRLMENDSTVLSFPDRCEEWGSNKYRGNCTGWIHAFLIWKYKVKKFAEVFAGSGTGYDVCRDMGIPYIGADLNPNPVRSGIMPIDVISEEVPAAFCDADMIFMHPPYGQEIGIPYAGAMYPDPTGELSRCDLGQMPWEEFISSLNAVIMKYYASMMPGARMSILMGDVRRNGRFYSMLSDIVKPGELQQIVVKVQHNVQSGNQVYSNRNYVPIAHEYLMIIRKNDTYWISFQMPKQFTKDIRDCKMATWRDVVAAALRRLGGTAHVSEIYRELKGHEKAEKNRNPEAKIRQTLQINSMFVSKERGVWQIA